MSNFLSWVKFIAGLIFVPAVRAATKKALDEWASMPGPVVDAPAADPEWAATLIDQRRANG